MKSEEFHIIMKHPFELSKEETHSISKLVEQYPYFQTARILLLRGSKENNHQEYLDFLKTTAIYTSDRSLLFDYIHHQQILEDNIQEELKKVEESSIPISSKTLKDTHQEKFNIQQTLSFSEWLKISSNSSVEKSKNEKFSAIDRFIVLNPKLSPPKKRRENSDIALQSITENHTIMTETLANLYVEQKKYNKAIQAFKILSLKFPEKSGFFADRVRAIQNLDKKESL